MDGPLSDGPDMTNARPATSDAVDRGTRVGRTREARQRAARLLRGSGILLAFVVLIAFGALQSEHFLTFDNSASSRSATPLSWPAVFRGPWPS